MIEDWQQREACNLGKTSEECKDINTEEINDG